MENMLNEKGSNHIASFSVELESGDTGRFNEFLHRLEELLGAHQRQEQYIFEFCRENLLTLGYHGHSRSDVLSAIHEKMSVGPRRQLNLWVKFEDWLRTYDAADTRTAANLRQLPVMAAVNVARVASPSGIRELAKRVTEAKADTRAQVERIAHESGLARPKVESQPKLSGGTMRRTVRHWLSMAREASEAKRLDTKQAKEDALISELMSWLEGKGAGAK
jgi:hypothetical protein